MSQTGFAVIDFETTGFSPNKGDRVVEVGLVLLDQHGDPESTFSTLINPLRDVGATRIHGITPTDVMDAPTFDLIAPELLALLKGRVVVAHNASFDTNFLVAEFAAAGITIDKGSMPVLCTMRTASELLPGVGRSLAACCEAYDIDLSNAHCAKDDAIATAKLLRSYFDQEPNFSLWDELLEQASAFEWPSVEFVSAPTLERGEERVGTGNVVEKYITRLPDPAGTIEERGLRRLFDDILSDGLMTDDESALVEDYVNSTGISESKLSEIKAQYFLDIVNIAWADGELNAAEIAGIRYVGHLMGRTESEIQAKIDYPTELSDDEAPSFARFSIQLDEGDHVVLTGEMPNPRSYYEELLKENNLVCWPSVTQKVKVVIAQDQNSMSGKAKRARVLGIPVVSLEDFLKSIESSK